MICNVRVNVDNNSRAKRFAHCDPLNSDNPLSANLQQLNDQPTLKVTHEQYYLFWLTFECSTEQTRVYALSTPAYLAGAVISFGIFLEPVVFRIVFIQLFIFYESTSCNLIVLASQRTTSDSNYKMHPISIGLESRL